MKKLFLLVILIPFLGHAVQRKVLLELITNTSCPGCASANAALDQVVEEYGDQVVTIRYHAWWPSSSDPFYAANPDENRARVNYYGADYTPHLWIDGTIDGGYQSGPWRTYINSELSRATSISIDLQVEYDTTKNQGMVIATVSNQSDSSHSALRLFYVVTESNIYYAAPNGSTIHHQVMRDMIPSASGLPIDVPPHSSITDTQSFTIDPRWNERNCQIAVFVQNYATKRVFQAEARWLFPGTGVEVKKYHLNDSQGGNGNNTAQPGETVDLYMLVENTGKTLIPAFTATLASSDPYITLQTATAGFDTIPVFGERMNATPFVISIDPNTPPGHLTWLYVHIPVNTDTIVDSIPYMVSYSAGFFDNVEGDTLWTHGGQNDLWHVTAHRSHTPHHSWYCGDENTGQYTNLMDASLESPWIVVPNNGFLAFFTFYNIATGDVGLLQYFNGKRWITIDEYSGFHLWGLETVYLNDMPGMATKIRFRLVTDSSSTREGWYIDDIILGPVTGVDENSAPAGDMKVAKITNRFAEIVYTAPGTEVLKLKIYDSAGRLRDVLRKRVREGRNIIRVDLGGYGSGVYFVRVKGRVIKLGIVR